MKAQKKARKEEVTILQIDKEILNLLNTYALDNPVIVIKEDGEYYVSTKQITDMDFKDFK